MKSKILIAGFVGALAYSATLNAATLIEMADDGEVMKMWLEGTKLRQDAEGGYVIMDWDAGKWYFVNLDGGMVIDLSHMLSAKSGTGGPGQGVDGASVDKVGGGPTIAGYDTVHYEISIDGEPCQDIFVSTKAMRDIGSNDVFERLQSMDQDDDEDMDFGYGSPCDQADQAYDLSKLGFPMRIEETESGEVFEVRRIEVDAKLPDGGFELPAGMQIMDMSQMMQMQ